MVEQHFCLRWNNYRTNITAEFEVLREGEHFVDVTLACDGRQLKAHKVVLSACSPYFKDLLQGNPCTHPIIILRDVGYVHMRGLLEFMYAGEVNVSQAHLASFLRTAEALKVRGLAEAPAPVEQHHSMQQAAVAAAAAAAVTNSVADLLALKSSIGNLPLVPLTSSPHTPVGPHLDTKGLHQSIHISSVGHHNNNSSNNNNSCSDSVNKSHMSGEPLSLTVNNNSIEPKDRRSVSPPQQSNKRLKCNHSSEGSAPGSPYYPSNTPHSNGSDIPTEDVAHDLSNSSKQQRCAASNSNLSTANGNSPTVTPTSAAVASLPPSLIPSSPEHMQYVFKSEPLDPCGGGSDTEGGGSWHEDSDGEVGGVGSGVQGVGDGGGGGGGVLAPPPHHTSTTTSSQPPTNSSTAQYHHSLLSSDTSPTSHQQHATPHLIHATMPPQESHLAGLPSDERLYGIEDYRPDNRLADPLDPGRGSPTLPPSSLPHECQVCGKLISCRRNLWKHMERVHLTNPAVRCSICAKLFKNKYALKDHQRIYHGGQSELVPQSLHQTQGNLLSRILRDARPSCPPLGALPSCSIISVGPSSSLDTRPPRELAPIPRSISHHNMDGMPPRELGPMPHTGPHQGMDGMRPYRRRHQDEDERGSSSMSRFGDRPPLLAPPAPASMQAPTSPPIGVVSVRRDWSTQENSMGGAGNHPLFSELQNLSGKNE